jgi:hypothetical protein
VVILPLPPPVELEALLEALLGRKVKSGAAAAPPAGKVAVAYYETDPPELSAAVLCDVPLAAALGCALSSVPPAVAQESAVAGALDASLSENVGEVMNVATRFLASRSGLRFVLRGFWCPPTDVPGDKIAAARGSDEIRAFRLEVAGYGAGELAFCTL